MLFQHGLTPSDQCQENAESVKQCGCNVELCASRAAAGRAPLAGTQPRLPCPSSPQHCLQLSAAGPQRGPGRRLLRPCAPQRCLNKICNPGPQTQADLSAASCETAAGSPSSSSSASSMWLSSAGATCCLRCFAGQCMPRQLTSQSTHAVPWRLAGPRLRPHAWQSTQARLTAVGLCTKEQPDSNLQHTPFHCIPARPCKCSRGSRSGAKQHNSNLPSTRPVSRVFILLHSSWSRSALASCILHPQIDRDEAHGPDQA